MASKEFEYLGTKVKIVFFEKKLALEMSFSKKSGRTWVKEYEGFPLLVKEP